MIDITRASELEEARARIRELLIDALDHHALTAGDVLACTQAAVTLGDDDLIDRAAAVLATRAKAYTPVDLSASAARDFALAYELIREQADPG
jgi:hypothetical protein